MKICRRNFLKSGMMVAGAVTGGGCAMVSGSAAGGINYKRWSEKPVFPHGEKGSWNEWESGHPGVFQDDDGQVYLFFQGKPTLKGDYLLSCAKVKFMD